MNTVSRAALLTVAAVFVAGVVYLFAPDRANDIIQKTMTEQKQSSGVPPGAGNTQKKKKCLIM